MKSKLLSTAFSILALSACNQIPAESYYNRGDPESLLDSSSEVVNVELRSKSSLHELTQWVNRDQPSRAELGCDEADPLCDQARNVLEQFGVPYTTNGSGAGIALIYDRVVARDCETRFIDNHVNPYEMNHPTFGCATASNLVQMVSDKRQFTSPALMNDTDADKAVQAVQNYRTPNAFTPSSVDTEMPSLLEKIQQMTGGGGR